MTPAQRRTLGTLAALCYVAATLGTGTAIVVWAVWAVGGPVPPRILTSLYVLAAVAVAAGTTLYTLNRRWTRR